MDVIVEPPPQVRPGTTLTPPIIIRLAKTDVEDEVERDTSRLFAFVSVTSEDGSTSLAPPSSDLVSGNLSDSVHTLESDSESDDEEVGFLSFPDIKIQNPGNYRLRVSLMRIDAGGSSEPRGAMSLQSTLSRVIRVDNEAEESPPGMCCFLQGSDKT